MNILGVGATIFVATRILDDNFLKIPNPNASSRVAYQRCLACNYEFAGATVSKKAHVTGIEINKTRVKACLRPNAALVLEIKSEIAKAKVDKIADSQRQELLGHSVDIAQILSKNGKPQTDQAVLKFLAVNDLTPNLLESPAFKELCKCISQSGVQYMPPERRN